MKTLHNDLIEENSGQIEITSLILQMSTDLSVFAVLLGTTETDFSGGRLDQMELASFSTRLHTDSIFENFFVRN